MLRTYNTLIIACNMCNQPREALSVYNEMMNEGFSANSTTYNALISAYGKLGARPGIGATCRAPPAARRCCPCAPAPRGRPA